MQSFGGQNVPAGSYPAFAGASEVNSLGYKFYRSSYQRLEAMDSVYRLEFTIPHVASAAKFDFRGFGLQGLADESWGLDNVRVTATTLPTVSITAEAGATEAGEFGQFKFVRTGNLSNELVVSYTVDGTADNEIDYDLLNGSIRFDPNVSEVLLPVVTFEDPYAEGTETVRLLLTPSASYTFSQYGTATVEITEADLPVASVEWIHASRLEGESTRLRVYLDRPSVTDTIVRLELEGSATNGVDYDAVPVTLMIPAGSVETFIDVGIVDDTDDEGEEFATANVLEGIGYWILPNATSTLLLADAGAADVRPTISWQKGPTTLADPLKISLWDNAFVVEGPADDRRLRVKDNSFAWINDNVDRFRIQIRDESFSRNGTVDSITATLSTIDSGDYNDPERMIRLTETGPNTGVFVSRNMILVSNAIDDEWHPEGQANVDNSPDDPTINIALDGSVSVKYGTLEPKLIPLPAKREIVLEAVILKKPGLEPPTVDRPDVEAQIKATQEIWAQFATRIKFTIQVKDAIGADPTAPLVLATDLATVDGQKRPLLSDVAKSLIDSHRGDPNRIHVYYIESFEEDGLGTTLGQTVADWTFVDADSRVNSVFIGFEGSKSRTTLAHEIGHVLGLKHVVKGEQAILSNLMAVKVSNAPAMSVFASSRIASDQANLLRNPTFNKKLNLLKRL